MQNHFSPLAGLFADKVMLTINRQGDKQKFYANCEYVRYKEKFHHYAMAQINKDGLAAVFQNIDYIYCEVKPLTEDKKEKFENNQERTNAEIFYKDEPFLSGLVSIYHSQHEAHNNIKIIHNDMLYIFYVTHNAWKYFNFITFNVKNVEELEIKQIS